MDSINLNPAEEQSGLFDDHFQYTEASQGQRFLNWLIDNILLRLIITYLTGEVAVQFLFNIAPEYTVRVFSEQSFESYLVSYIIVGFHYIFYYTICEKAFKGYTLGKLITGTRSIGTDGQELTLKDALLRSLSRFVPFEAFSGLGDAPWHDTWTNTTVIKSR
ncbi:MAG: RDD family protein [Chitinophagaceae bacterium]|nr:RDD family protein [Chitinophagaceae bacterium]MBK8951149.1 RDD family protein [Chitinophagaceae bacterium]